MVLYQNGDFEAFSALYQRHSRRVYEYLLRKSDKQTASELLQETFLKVHRARAQYSISYPFLPWLFTISRTVFLDYIRRAESRLIKFSSSSSSSATLVRHEPLAQMPGSQVDLSLALTYLPENQRRSIELRYLNDWSFEQIALELKTSPGNARQMISRGLCQLRVLLQGGKK
jgi:RNA polymerase sigma-70 factor (ECF subfamily)